MPKQKEYCCKNSECGSCGVIVTSGPVVNGKPKCRECGEGVVEIETYNL